MKKLAILIVGILICFTAIGQTNHLTLYKLPEKNKTKRIKLNKPINFVIDLHTTDTLDSWMRIEGKLLNVGIDSLTVEYKKEYYSKLITTPMASTTTTKTIKFNDSVFGKQFSKSYAIDDIDYIDFIRSSETLEGIGIAGIIISALTTFVVAPLVSINYKDGTFNSNTYKNWALAGTAGMAISIPITIFSSKSKRHAIDENEVGCIKKRCAKGAWTLRK
ncbi:MAG: hypothetical protein DRI97_05080 [Bacteroidetes bacterium]|nr:MAG: hypothetical protein DRI97_05080 [Bacteroidota bacterium]